MGLCGPFSQSPVHVLFVERREVAMAGKGWETTDVPPYWTRCLTGHSHPSGWDSQQIVSLLDSTQPWFTVEWGSSIEIFTTSNHIYSEHLCLLCCLGEKKIYKSELLCLETLQIHSELHLTESQCPLACMIFIISLTRHRPYSTASEDAF